MAILSEIYSLSYFPLSNLRYVDVLIPLEESIRKNIYSKNTDSKLWLDFVSMYDGHTFVRIDTGEYTVRVIGILPRKYDKFSLENVHDVILKIDSSLMFSAIQYIKFEIMTHLLWNRLSNYENIYSNSRKDLIK
jgi:hypothetical protein